MQYKRLVHTTNTQNEWTLIVILMNNNWIYWKLRPLPNMIWKDNTTIMCNFDMSTIVYLRLWRSCSTKYLRLQNCICNFDANRIIYRRLWRSCRIEHSAKTWLSEYTGSMSKLWNLSSPPHEADHSVHFYFKMKGYGSDHLFLVIIRSHTSK